MGKAQLQIQGIAEIVKITVSNNRKFARYLVYKLGLLMSRVGGKDEICNDVSLILPK